MISARAGLGCLIMRLRLNTSMRKIAIALCGASLALVILISSVRTLLAWASSQGDPPFNWIRAAHIEPSNAEWHCDLGIYHAVWKNEPGAAVPELETSVRLNPYNAACWTALGDAYGHAGDLANQRRTLEAALKVEPNDAPLALQAATIFANSNEVQRALPLYRVAIEKRPAWAQEIIRHAWFHEPDPEQLLTNAIPPTPSAKLILLRLLVEQQQWGGAELVWQNVIQSKDVFDSKDALFYIDSLLAQGNLERALKSWKQLAARDPQLSDTASAGNLIVNPGFERNILNGGFGWTYQRVNGVDITMDTAEFHSGMRSLSFNFDIEGIGITGLKQLVVVQPGSQYSFSAWIRADSVEAVNGPRLAFVDAQTHQPVFSTEDVLGSFPWRRMTGEFSTGPKTNLLELSVVRTPSDGRIRGRVWIDDIELVRN